VVNCVRKHCCFFVRKKYHQLFSLISWIELKVIHFACLDTHKNCQTQNIYRQYYIPVNQYMGFYLFIFYLVSVVEFCEITYIIVHDIFLVVRPQHNQNELVVKVKQNKNLKFYQIYCLSTA